MVSKRQLALFLGALLGLGLACAKPTKVVVKPSRVDLYVIDGTKSLSVSVLDQKDREMKKVLLDFESSAPEVATVDKNGIVTAKSSGEAIVTARAGRISGTASIVVKAVKDINLVLPESGAVGVAGSTIPLIVKATNEKDEVVEDISGAAFQSSAPNFATVDNKGVLTLVSTGSTKITATMGKATKELPVNVEIEVPAAVKVDNPNQSVALGESQPLEFMILSSRGRPMKTTVSFSTSLPAVATVDAKGIVTGVGRGTTSITVSAGDARNEVKVTVH
jgi:hypothetical protein